MSHLKELINLGFLIDEKASKIVEGLSEEDFKRLVGSLKKEDFIVTEDIVKKNLLEELKILKIFEKVKTFSIQDMVKMLNERYESLKNILIKKIDLENVVSINKCSSGKVSIIGMVKSKDEKAEDYAVLLEDPTGEIQTIIPKTIGEKISLDDIIAVSGNINNKILFVDKLFFPDVPIRPVNYSLNDIKVAFLSEKKNIEANYFVYKDKVEDKIKNKKYDITNPSMIKIDNIIILIACSFDPLSLLRKRYVNIENTDFLIDLVPDVLFTDKGIDTNYKGITVVSLDRIINLKTREVTDLT